MKIKNSDIAFSEIIHIIHCSSAGLHCSMMLICSIYFSTMHICNNTYLLSSQNNNSPKKTCCDNTSRKITEENAHIYTFSNL